MDSSFPPEHPSCTPDEAKLCKNYQVKCWHCSIGESLFWSPADEKTKHHTFWDRKREKLEEKRALGKGKMGGKGTKTKDKKQVLADKAEKRVKKSLNKRFSDDRFDEIFKETLNSGRVRNDGDISGYCSLVDVKSTTRTTSWVTEKPQLSKAQAQARSHGKPYGIIVNENSSLEAVAVMAVADLTHLFQYVAYLEKRLAAAENGEHDVP